ncbi:MAG: phosphoglycerate mutase, partial [Ramlibacter sp.]
MSDSVHLLIPFAASTAPGCVQALRTLELPQLEKLLVRLSPAGTDMGEESALSMPHERVLARECGLPQADGRIPWAGWQVRQAGHDPGAAAWARITPCHWRVATDHVLMSHPQDLHLDAEDSQLLLAAMLPYFEQDGIKLEYEAPTLWLAQGEVFRDMAAASLDRVVGRRIDPWMPREAQAGLLRRLQQEMQMLLYTHEVNEERVRGGLLPV